MTNARDEKGMAGTLEIDPAKNPKKLRMTAKRDDNTKIEMDAIFVLEGDTLKTCYGNKKPKEFKTESDRDADQRLHVYRRKRE
jgi:uncharacterized protein (TIGR03067 family)